MKAWADAAEVPGGDLENYEFLGRGGSAVVFRARQPLLNRIVAVKVPEGVDLRPDGLLREARMQAAMSWHSNVVTLLGTTELDDGRTGLLLEYAPGGSLADLVRRNGPLSNSRWRQVGAEVASALAAAHSAGFVHRDVKPSNVLFAADDTSRLADFGLTASTLSTIDEWSGSVAYAPPELLEGTPPAAPNDVYSLALTLLEAATGRPAFDAAALPPAAVMARIQSERLRFSEHVDGIEPKLGALLDAALDHDPDRRPTARALAEALGQRQPASVRTAPPDRRQPLVITASIAILVALIGTVLAVGAWTRTENDPPVDLCASYREYGEARTKLFNQAASDLEQATSPYEVVEGLLTKYPREWAAATMKYAIAAASFAGEEVVMTETQLAQLTQADVLNRAVVGGKPFLFDGQGAQLDVASVPSTLRVPAAAHSEALELGAMNCPGEIADLAESRARLYTSTYANLMNAKFMSGFFDDPRSIDLLDATTVLTLIEVGRPFVEGVLQGRWSWIFDLMSNSPEIGEALAVEAPDFLLQAGSKSPERFRASMTENRREQIRTGFNRLGPATQAGLAAAYPEQLSLLGIGVTE